MPLQTGVWSLNSNGALGQLAITGVDPAGTVTGTLTASGGTASTIAGFWDENSQKLSIAVGYQAFTGFMFEDQYRMPGITGAVVFTLAGFVEEFTSTGGAGAGRAVFGWYAQIGVT